MKIQGTDIDVSFENVTPEWAKKILEEQNKSNRDMRSQNVLKLQGTIVRGEFLPTHQGIALTATNELLDGQHRLQAIVNSGIAVWMFVFRNVPDLSKSVIDTHVGRTLADGAKTLGYIDANSTKMALLRAMWIRHGDRRLWPNSRFIELYKEYQDAVEYAVGLTNGYPAGLRTAPTGAVIARLFATGISQDRIEYASSILKTGMSVEGMLPTASDGALILYQRRCQQQKKKLLARDQYALCERAFEFFLKGETVGKLHPKDEELFPLPEDTKFGKDI